MRWNVEMSDHKGPPRTHQLGQNHQIGRYCHSTRHYYRYYRIHQIGLARTGTVKRDEVYSVLQCSLVLQSEAQFIAVQY